MDKIPVLVVDDSETIREFLVKCMENENYEVDQVSNALDGINLAKNKKYHLILLDVIMPGIDGFEACKKIKEEGLSKNTPVIFISGEDGSEYNLKGHDVGSVDYLTKPINLKQLLIKSSVHIKNSLLLQKLELYQDRMQMDIKKAGSFYHAFLPVKQEVKYIEERHSVSIDSYFLPFNEIGGDFWKVISINKHKFGILYVDFSGHGVASALNVAYLNAILSHKITWEDPIQVLKFINKHLKNSLQLGSFATAIYLVFDDRNNSIKYVNCASPYPLIIKNSKNEVEFFDKNIQPLGIEDSDKLDMQIEEIILKEGEVFLVYSDVLLESEHLPASNRWMLEGLSESIAKLNVTSKTKLTDLRDVFFKTAHVPLSDDLTMISIGLKNKD